MPSQLAPRPARRAAAILGVFVWGVAAFSPLDSPADRTIHPSRRAVPGWESLSPRLAEFPEKDRAAFAVLAAAEAGLIDPGGRTWDYLRVEGGDGEWKATYEIINCLPPGSTGEICPRSGEYATAKFVREGDRFVIREVSGAATGEERDRFLGTNLPIPSGPPRFEDVAVAGVPLGDGTSFAGWLLWVGPIPAPGELHVVCGLEARDSGGKLVRRNRGIQMDPPGRGDNPNAPDDGEAARDGNVPWVWGAGGPIVPGTPEDYTAAHRCSTYWWTEGPRLGDLTSGGYRITGARIRNTAPVYDATAPVKLQIHYLYGWAGDEFPGDRKCRWKLIDESGNVFASETIYINERSPAARNAVARIDVDQVPTEIDFSCRP